MATKISVPVLMSADLEKALSARAEALKISRSEVARRAIASACEYDLASEAPTPRRKKYSTPAEAEAARKAASKARRDDERALKEAVARFRKNQDIEALAASLRPTPGVAAGVLPEVDGNE